MECQGSVSSQVASQIDRFGELVTADPWSGPLPARVILSSDFASTLRSNLPDDRFRAWEARQKARGENHGARGAGMGFRATNGEFVAVVDAVDLPDEVLLALACHEIVECVLGASKDTADDDDARDTMDEAMTRLMWSEYVVERKRRTIFEAEGWGDSVLDHSFVNSTADQYEQELPQLVRWAVRNDAVHPNVYGNWQLLAHGVAHAAARADAGYAPERAELDSFLTRGWSPGTANAWRDARNLLPSLYDRPDLTVAELDGKVVTGAWQPIYEALADDYNKLYAQATGQHYP